METITLKPYLSNNFNIDDIIYSNIINERDGKKTIFLYDKEIGKKIYIQTPMLRNMINISKKDKYDELNIPLYGSKKNKINEFIEFIKKLDNKVISDAKKYKNEWFSNNSNIRYRSLIKNIHDDYIDTIEYKIGMFENGIIKFKITNCTSITVNEQIVNAEQLFVEQDIRTIFQIYAIWISGDLFGIYLKPIKIDQKIKPIETIEFIDVSDDDSVYNTEMNNLSDNSNSDSDISNKSNNSIESNKSKQFKKILDLNNADNNADNNYDFSQVLSDNMSSDNMSSDDVSSISTASIDSSKSININII